MYAIRSYYGILATMHDARTLHSREVLARVHEAFGDQLLHTVIARTVWQDQALSKIKL